MRGVARGEYQVVGQLAHAAPALDEIGRDAAWRGELGGWKIHNVAKFLAVRRYMPWEADRVIAWCHRNMPGGAGAFRVTKARQTYERALTAVINDRAVDWSEWDGHKWIHRRSRWA